MLTEDVINLRKSMNILVALNHNNMPISWHTHVYTCLHMDKDN